MTSVVSFDEMSRKWTVHDEPNETVKIDDCLLMSLSLSECSGRVSLPLAYLLMRQEFSS